MQRRRFLVTLPLSVLALGHARAEEPVIKAPRIVEALRKKDIVVEGPGVAPAPAIDLQVQFTFGSAQLLPAGKRQLDQLAMALDDNELSSAAFELGGHTDAVGGYATNMRLSLLRAEAVKTYLVKAHGVPAERLFPIGFGFTRLAEPSRPEAAVNRRVEVRRMSQLPPADRPLGGRLVPTPQ